MYDVCGGLLIDYFVEFTGETIFSERELTFTFAVCYRCSVCLFVMIVHPTQPVGILGSFSSQFATLAIH